MGYDAKRDQTGVRIWHQSFIVLGNVPCYEDAMRRHLTKLSSDTDVVSHGQPDGTQSANYSGDDTRYAALYARCMAAGAARTAFAAHDTGNRAW